jgi:hypothetical protein
MMTGETADLDPMEELERPHQEIQKKIAERAADERFWFIPGFETGLLKITGVVEIRVDQPDFDISKLPILSPERAATLGIDRLVTETAPPGGIGRIVGYLVRSELDTGVIDTVRNNYRYSQTATEATL